MLKMYCYGSSSKGNCFILENNKTSIMLDCGVKNIENKINIKSIAGILLSHQHL